MLNKKKILSIASAGIALMAITGSVYAATSPTTTGDTTQQPVSTDHHMKQKHGHSNQELLTLLGIDNATLMQDFKAGQSLADIAKAKTVDEQKVIDLLVNQESQRIDKAVTSGKLTQDKADQIKSKLPDQVKQRVEHKGGFGGERGRGHEEGGLKDVASVLGTTTTDLQTQLKAGKTIAQIAQAKQISEDSLINQLLQKDKDRLTKMVEKTWKHKDGGATQDDSSTSAATTATPPAASTTPAQ
jgi:ribosomal protein S20